MKIEIIGHFVFFTTSPKKKSGICIAEPHVDKGGFTFHLHESTSGLQYLNQEKEWKDVVLDESNTILFPGIQIQYASKCKVIALCHRVIAHAISEHIGRFSAVCFIDMAHTPVYNKARHGRMQRHPIGFNYDMDFPTFKKLFTKPNR